MTLADNAQKRIEEYLGTLRGLLRGVNEQDTHEFVEELRSHIQDKISSSGEMTPVVVEEVLAALGNPAELAREFRTSVLLIGAEKSNSPIQILPILFRWTSLSLTGLFVSLGAIGGYFVGGVLFICAMLKPFYPDTAGLWAFHDVTGDLNLSLRLGSANPPASAHELLGWWIVPIGVLLAFGLVLSTSRIARRCSRKVRGSIAIA